MTCAALLLWFGVSAGSTVYVPQAALANYTPSQLAFAKRCAHRHKIKWRVVS